MPALWVDVAPWGQPLQFDKPFAQRQAEQAEQVAPLLRWADVQAHQGHWVAGYVRYEAACAWDLPVHPTTQPLAWFGCYAPPQPACYPHLPTPPPVTLELLIQQARYDQDLKRILDFIHAGDTYQVNHTVRALPHFEGTLLDLFLDRQARYRFPYAIWLESPGTSVASLSPELFLHRQGSLVTTAPIKGTRPRGETLAEDQQLAMALSQASKDAAEHIMIVDMARNDLGRVCETGTIRVPHLKNRRSFATVHHLESRVEGRLREGLDLAHLFEALFPAASITGAPKKRTMEIIKSLEPQPRSLYTGCVGVIRPGGEALFNVAIRTLEQQGHTPPLLGLGGGIVADSQPLDEWQELAHKGGFLTNPPTLEAPGLIETMGVADAGMIPWRTQHMARMRHAAAALGIPFNAQTAQDLVDTALVQKPHMVRLALHSSGFLEYTTPPRPQPQHGLKLWIYPHAVDGEDPLLRYKTSRRTLFNEALSQARAQGFDDVLFVNTHGHVTECAIRAILLQCHGQWYAPPLQDGLLDSLWRRHALAHYGATPRSLSLADLQQAQQMRVGNALQGEQSVLSLHTCTDPWVSYHSFSTF
ncbi:para-aminobenzoate synthase component I [Magnetococcus marinus MC-1]|uniref:Para-aminobenzoate synthase component I n=1 Tax=Magnetococcus marinus (strain ATCC BAA-1437 / JCM 17883 / MC-1) TaxID=156889 RepID=A0L4R0_MAGMM|nr:aminodeoxychorismate synthase, component I [Magnetococcus marinus]ABK42953.1 para-aminobenzoate synthase component I [Magnetococcus marinus MC-1]